MQFWRLTGLVDCPNSWRVRKREKCVKGFYINWTRMDNLSRILVKKSNFSRLTKFLISKGELKMLFLLLLVVTDAVVSVVSVVVVQK